MAARALRAAVVVAATLAVSSHLLAAEAAAVFGDADAPVQCATATSSSDATVRRSWCAAGGLGRPCDIGTCDGATRRASSLAAVSASACDVESATWYQDGIYWASGRAANGTAITAPKADTVTLGPGIIVFNQSIPAWQPFGPTTGLHVPSGIDVRGLCPPGSAPGGRETVLMPGPSSGNATSRLWSLVLVSDSRMGWASAVDIKPATNATVRQLVLSGVWSGDEPRWRNCSAEGAVAGTAPSAVPPPQMRVARGIYLPYAGSGVHVEDCTVLHTFGNAIETGVFDQWTPADPADAGDPSCANGTRWCRGNVLGFTGTPAAPNRVSNNTLCDCRFGGVTIIGHHAAVTGNDVAVSEKVWTSATQQSGTTMGVSAAFVGSSNVSVTDNAIAGADYGVGSDGSFPLYVTVAMFQHFWGTIYARMSPAFRQRYNATSPPLDSHGDLAFDTVQDFVNAQQVLLDLSVAAHVSSTDPTVYDAGFGVDIVVSGNTIKDSVVGVSLYRQRRFTVTRNTITSSSANALGMWGVLLDHSHNATASSNKISGWQAGVMVRGVPGTLSRLGGSYSDVGGWSVNDRRVGDNGGGNDDDDNNGGNTVSNSTVCIRFWGAGYDNAVRNNVCSDWTAPHACDYAGARRQRPGVDWTTGNTPESCNRDYDSARTPR